MTGRSRRVIMDAHGRQRVESRSPRTNLAETDAFMRGAKKILIFSDAGGTGRSYHASLTCENQTRRNHYLLEPGWRADAAIQGLGRTHRTHQATAPLFRPVSTDCRGERRFISTIARRLDSLGALTRGQRQTGGQGLFDPRDNLESDYAKESLEQWFRLLADGKLRSTTLDQFQKLTGLELEGEGGGLKEDLPPIQRWLNRILALRIALQNAIFDEYLGLIEARIEAAKEAGTLDLGVESINAERITILDRTVIRRDQTSGAETEILRLETEERYKPLALDRALRILGDDARPMVNRKSGKAAIRCSTYSLTDDDGEIVRRYELVRPTRSERMRQDLLVETMWEEASEEEFAALWQAEVEEMSGKTRTSTLYLVTGLLLPVWDRLPDDHVQVWRLNTDDGESFLGRIVPCPVGLQTRGRLRHRRDDHRLGGRDRQARHHERRDRGLGRVPAEAQPGRGPAAPRTARLAAHAACRAEGGRLLHRDHPAQDANVRARRDRRDRDRPHHRLTNQGLPPRSIKGRGGSLRLFEPDEQARVTVGHGCADPRMEYDR